MHRCPLLAALRHRGLTTDEQADTAWASAMAGRVGPGLDSLWCRVGAVVASAPAGELLGDVLGSSDRDALFQFGPAPDWYKLGFATRAPYTGSCGNDFV